MCNSPDNPIVLKFADWPELDQVAWNDLFVKGGLFDNTGRCQDWSVGTRTIRKQGYGQWLSFLRRNTPEVLGNPPVSRITQGRVGTYIQECQQRLSHRSVANLVSGLFVIARVFAPTYDWEWLLRASNRLSNRAEVHALPPPISLTAAEIFSWSLARMEEVHDDLDLSGLKRAIHFRQALMIGFLIARPVRRRTLLVIQVEKHLLPVTDGFVLRFGREDMKDKKARSFPLPKRLVAPMQRYFKFHRPELLGHKTSNALWISQYGDAITPDGYSRELPKITERHLGVPLRPHAFRHIAATSIAEFDPEHVGIIRDILCHATLDMAQKHYNRATGISSSAGLQSIVEGILDNAPKMGRAKQTLMPPLCSERVDKK